MEFLRQLFAPLRSSPPPGPEPFWAEALGSAGGPSATVLRLRVGEQHLSALDLALRQRGLEPAGPPAGRWSSELRAAYLKELPDATWLLVLVGHRAEELRDGLQHEAGIPLEPGDEAACALEPQGEASPEAVWHVGLPSNWRDRCEAEERQLIEARAALDSRTPERRASGASTLARLELLDRAPWVERAVVFWEESQGRADLPLVTLLLRELRWLEAAHDPLVDPLLALLHLLAQENGALRGVVQGLRQPHALFGYEREQLLGQVPAEVAAAAAGVVPEGRRGYAGPGRYEAALREVQDSATRAALRVEAAQVLLDRYQGGWSPLALHDVRELLRDALFQYSEGSHPLSRAGALYQLARLEAAEGATEASRAALEEAARCVIDERGLPRDEQLAREILERLG